MGGYAEFVWPAFGLAVVVMVGLLVSSRLGLAARERELRALQAARDERDESHRPGNEP